MVFLTFKWGGRVGGHVFEWRGGRVGGHMPPPPKTTMFFSVCVGEIDVKKWGGQSGGGRKSGGASGGGIGSAPPPLKNTMPVVGKT